MIYVSSDVVLDDISGDFRPNGPLVGYRNLITFASLSSDEAAAGYPVTNLSNPNTSEPWKAESDAEQAVTVFLASAGEADYVGIARHNLGSTGTTCQVQTSDDGATWDDLGDDFIPPDDAPIMVRFPVTTAQWFRLLLTPVTDAIPSIAVLYVGKLLVLQRNIARGYTPMTYNYANTSSVGLSESGEFLGAIAQRANPSTEVPQKHLTPTWFRSNMAPFFKQCVGNGADRYRTPFFFAWRPTTYPAEVAFGWFPEGNPPQASNAGPVGLVDASFTMQGIS